MSTKVTGDVLDNQASRIDVKNNGSLVVNTNDINFIGGTGITISSANASGQANITLNGFNGAYSSLSGRPTALSDFTNDVGYVTSDNTLSNEQVQDIVGNMISGNTENGISVTYQDGNGTIDFSVSGLTTSNFNSSNISQWTNNAGYLTSVNNSNWSGSDLSVSNGGTGTSSITGIVKGNGTSAFTSASAGTDYTTPNGDETLTNKRLNPRIQNYGGSGTLSVNSNNIDIVTATLFGNITINSPSGSPVQGQALIYRIKDNGTSRTITFDSIFRAIGVTLPTETVASKLLYVSCMYNSTDSKWDVIGVAQEE